MLSGQGLVAVPKREFLLITTKEDAECCLETRVYGVADIVANQSNADPKCDGLVDLIVNTVATSTWSNFRGPGTIGGWCGSLTISQTAEVHELVEELLATLEVRKLQVGGNATKEVFADRSQPSQSFRKVLGLKLDIDYEESPLVDVLTDLKLRTGIDFFWIAKCSAMPASTPPRCRSRFSFATSRLGPRWDRSQRPGLNLVFQRRSIQDHHQEDAETQLVLGVYPIADLVGPHSLTDSEKKLEYPATNLDDLVDVIVTSTATATWSELGGPGTLWGFDAEYPMLVCSQTAEVHEMIGQLLAELRRGARRPSGGVGKASGHTGEIRTLCVASLPAEAGRQRRTRRAAERGCFAGESARRPQALGARRSVRSRHGRPIDRATETLGSPKNPKISKISMSSASQNSRWGAVSA